MPRLTDSERDAFLNDHPDWLATSTQTTLTRKLKFKDFKAAWAFMTRVAAVADRMDHHPDWSNSYNRVTVSLTTHDAGGLTPRDVALAQAIDAVVTPP